MPVVYWLLGVIGIRAFLCVYRIISAASFAWNKHRKQRRKITKRLYFWHLLKVTCLVILMAGTCDEIVAAFLHDVSEDQKVTIAEISKCFGNKVAAIVAACTDDKSIPWQIRKTVKPKNIRERKYSYSVLKLMTADVIANMIDMIFEIPRFGIGVFKDPEGVAHKWSDKSHALEEVTRKTRLHFWAVIAVSISNKLVKDVKKARRKQ